MRESSHARRRFWNAVECWIKRAMLKKNNLGLRWNDVKRT
jgi:hypothetical protein